MPRSKGTTEETDLARRVFLVLKTNDRGELVSSHRHGVTAVLRRQDEQWSGSARVVLEVSASASDIETATCELSRQLVNDGNKKLGMFRLGVINQWEVEDDTPLPDIRALAFDKEQAKLMRRLLYYAQAKMTTLSTRELRMAAELIRQVS